MHALQEGMYFFSAGSIELLHLSLCSWLFWC